MTANGSGGDEREKGEPPKQLPEGVSALRWMIADAEGLAHLNYPTLDEARKDPGAAVVFEADCGGQILLTCPARYVKCEMGALLQLLADLEQMTWGIGFDPEVREASSDSGVYFEKLSVGCGVAGGMGGGIVCNGAWLHDEVEGWGLRPQIEEVLRGTRERLDVAKGFPDVPLSNLQEARRYPTARATLVSTMHGFPLVDCLVSLIKTEESNLLKLIETLEELVRDKIAYFFYVKSVRQATIHYRPGFAKLDRMAAPLVIGRLLDGTPIDLLERNRDMILSVLEGKPRELK